MRWLYTFKRADGRVFWRFAANGPPAFLVLLWVQWTELGSFTSIGAEEVAA